MAKDYKTIDGKINLDTNLTSTGSSQLEFNKSTLELRYAGNSCSLYRQALNLPCDEENRPGNTYNLYVYKLPKDQGVCFLQTYNQPGYAAWSAEII